MNYVDLFIGAVLIPPLLWLLFQLLREGARQRGWDREERRRQADDAARNEQMRRECKPPDGVPMSGNVFSSGEPAWQVFPVTMSDLALVGARIYTDEHGNVTRTEGGRYVPLDQLPVKPAETLAPQPEITVATLEEFRAALLTGGQRIHLVCRMSELLAEAAAHPWPDEVEVDIFAPPRPQQENT
jgi:hypothetical protein